MAQIKPKTNKNITTIGELRKKVAYLNDENLQMEGMMKVDGESDPEYLKRIAANKASISKYNKIIANPEKYKPSAPAKKPNMVTVGRLREVRDSLVSRGQAKMGAGDKQNELHKNPKAAQEMYKKGSADLDRADRYTKIINNASKKK